MDNIEYEVGYFEESKPIYEAKEGIQVNEAPYNENQEDEGNANIFSTVSNIANAAVGAGVLAVPYAFKCAGLIGGILILSFTISMTIYSLRMIVYCIEHTKKYNYDEVLQEAFGKFFGILMRILLGLITFGNQIVFLIILADSFPPLLQTINQHIVGGKIHWIFLNRYFITGLITLFFIFPLTCLKNLDSLKYPSAIAIFAVFYMVGLIIVFRIFFPFTEIIENPENPIVLFNFSFDIFLAFPIIIFAQNCHILTFPIMKELKGKSVPRMEWSTRIAVLIYAIIYMVCGVIGYLSFYGKTMENVLKNFETQKFNLAIVIAQLGISFTAIFSYPLQTYACRNALNILFFPGKEFAYWRHYFWAVLLVSSTFILSSVVPKVGVVFGFVGAAAGIFIMYILPSLMYLKLVVYEEKSFSMKKLLYSIIPILMIVVGTFLSIACTITVAYTEINSWFN
eukprot:gene9150-1238_t